MTRTLVLNFHGLGPVPGHVAAAEAPYWVDAGTFAEYLVRSRRHMASQPVRITFDDGNRSDLEIAVPLLLEFGLTADFFVCAGRIGAPGYLGRADIAELLARGMGVGCHGMDHVDWHTASGPDLHREIVEARQRLEDACGRPVRDFAAPFGAYDRRVLALIRRSGGECVYTSDGGTADMAGFLRPRNTLMAGPPVSLASLAGGGLPRAIRRLKVLAKRFRGAAA